MGIKTIEKGDQEYTQTELVKSKTDRGFGLITFSDRYQQECSLQDSSLATEAAIWLGIDVNLEGKEINARMHLTQTMVKQLLPYLKKFAEDGEYIANMKVK